MVRGGGGRRPHCLGSFDDSSNNNKHRAGQGRTGQGSENSTQHEYERAGGQRGGETGGMGGWRAQTMSAWTRRAKMRCDAMRWTRAAGRRSGSWSHPQGAAAS